MNELFYNFPCGCKFAQTSEAIKDYDGLPPLDIDYYNVRMDCPKTLQLLASGYTRGVFQLESNLGRAYSKKLEPDNIEQIADLIAILRPGSLQSLLDNKSMTMHYIDRKHKRESVTYIDDKLGEYLDDTFGIMIYQEQTIALAKGMAKFAPEQALALMKAIGKKKMDKLMALKPEFIKGCIDNSVNEDVATTIFENIEASGRYSFNACTSSDTILTKISVGNKKTDYTVQHMFNIKNDIEYAKKHNQLDLYKKYKNKGHYGYGLSMNTDGRIRRNIIKDIRYAGYREIFQIRLNNGNSVKATCNHKFPTPIGEMRLDELKIGDDLFICRKKVGEKGYPTLTSKIISIESCGFDDTYDIEMEAPNHNLVVNGDIVICNSHSAAYAHITYLTAYMKAHFPIHFFCSALKFVKDEDELKNLLSELPLFDVQILPPKVENLCARFNIVNGAIQYGIGEIRGCGVKTAETLIEHIEEAERTLNKEVKNFSWYEFLTLVACHVNCGHMNNLILCGFLDNDCSRKEQLHQYNIFNELSDGESKWALGNSHNYTNLPDLFSALLDGGKVTKKRQNKVKSLLLSLQNPGKSLLDDIDFICKNEKQLLGVSLSVSKTQDKEKFANIKCLDFVLGGGQKDLLFVVEVKDVDLRTIKTGQNAGKQMANIKLADRSGEMECTIFSKEWAEFRKDVIVGNVIMIRAGRHKDGSLRIDDIKLL